MVQASFKTKIGVWLCRLWERVVGSLLVGIQPHPFECDWKFKVHKMIISMKHSLMT